MPYPRNGRYPGADLYIDPTRGNYMLMDAFLNIDKDNEDKTKATDKENEHEAQPAGDGTVVKAGESDLFARFLKRRKLRLDIGLTTQSAPTSPANVSVEDFTWDEEEAISIKRKREEPDNGERGDRDEYRKGEDQEIIDGDRRMGVAIRKVIKELDKEIRTVAELAKERNTKKEIKEGASKMRSLMSQITTRDAQVLLQTLGRKIKDTKGGTSDEEVEKYEKQIQEHRKEIENMRNVIENRDKEIHKLKLERKRLEEENARLKKPNDPMVPQVEEAMFLNNENFDHFLKLERMEWRAGIYKAAFPAEGSPLTTNKDTDVLVLSEEGEEIYDKKGNELLEKTFRDRHPELKDLDGKLAAISICTRAIKAGDGSVETNKYIVRAELDLDKGEEEWFDTLRGVRDLLVDQNRKKLAVYPPSPDPEGIRTRKILEYVFRKTNIKCLLHTRNQTGVNERRGTAGPKRTDALIIKQDGKNYSELLKTLKQAVQPGTTPARAIRTIRETREGGMVLVLDKDVKAVEELREKISRVADIQVKTRMGDRGPKLFIYDIDGVTTSEEVKEAVRRELNASPESIAIGDLRKSAGGNQVATISLPEKMAETLVRKGRIRIGLSWCPIKERVEITRCFRCWKYGHMARDCKEDEDESKLCRKCGSDGHEAKGCTRGEFCLTCKVPGHTPGTGRCPEFRKAVAREKQRKKEIRKY